VEDICHEPKVGTNAEEGIVERRELGPRTLCVSADLASLVLYGHETVAA